VRLFVSPSSARVSGQSPIGANALVRTMTFDTKDSASGSDQAPAARGDPAGTPRHVVGSVPWNTE
jgi:hypothetical protein